MKGAANVNVPSNLDEPKGGSTPTATEGVRNRFGDCKLRCSGHGEAGATLDRSRVPNTEV